MPEITIPLSQARGVRIRCKCGAEATVPLSAVRAPVACFNCSEPWPEHAVKELARLLGWVQNDTTTKVDLVLLGSA